MIFKYLKRPFSEILCDLKSESTGLRIITLQHPTKRNALSSLLVSQLQDNLIALQKDSEARVMILRSSVENIFCAGADLKERATMPQNEIEGFVQKLRSTFSLIEDLPFPSIACIDGYALGGGLEMALACDLRIAGQGAKIGLVETGIAVIPGAGGTFRLPKIIGVQRAKEMIFTAAVYSAETAKNYGVFIEVCQDSYARAVEIANSIAKNGPIAIRMAKKAIDIGFGKEKNTGFQIEGLCYAGVVDTEDRIEALQAFKEKRKPVFKGR